VPSILCGLFLAGYPPKSSRGLHDMLNRHNADRTNPDRRAKMARTSTETQLLITPTGHGLVQFYDLLDDLYARPRIKPMLHLKPALNSIFNHLNGLRLRALEVGKVTQYLPRAIRFGAKVEIYSYAVDKVVVAF